MDVLFDLEHAARQMAVRVITVRRVRMQDNFRFFARQRGNRLVTCVRMDMALGFFETARQHRVRVARRRVDVAVGLVEAAGRLCALGHRIARIRMRVARRFLEPACADAFLRIARGCVRMGLNFRKRTEKLPVFVIAVRRVGMDKKVRISAHKGPVRSIAIRRMGMGTCLARKRLRFQRNSGRKGDKYRQENRQHRQNRHALPPFMTILLLPDFLRRMLFPLIVSHRHAPFPSNQIAPHRSSGQIRKKTVPKIRSSATQPIAAIRESLDVLRWSPNTKY